MNREALEKWADELQFGDNAQAMGTLFDPDSNAPHGYRMCGLGVACHTYAKEQGITVQELLSEHPPRRLGYLPKPVAEWLGLREPDESEIVDLNDMEELSLPELGSWVRDTWIKGQ